MAKIAMRRIFDEITETENTTNTMSINDIEKALCQNYMSRKKLDERGYSDEISENEYDMEGEALWER